MVDAVHAPFPMALGTIFSEESFGEGAITVNSVVIDSVPRLMILLHDAKNRTSLGYCLTIRGAKVFSDAIKQLNVGASEPESNKIAE